MTREQAIEIVKTQYPHDHVMKTALGLLIPELRESEDERIRKDIRLVVESSATKYFKETGQMPEWYDRIVAYLEKQKEHQPAEWSEEDKKMLVRCIAAIPVQGDEIMPTWYLNKLRDWLKSLPERLNLQPKQEWSEEDERRIDAICELLENTSAIHPNYSRRKLIIWLKSLRPSWKHSEDEERLINTSISFLKDFADKVYENAVECIDWLKSKLNGNSDK